VCAYLPRGCERGLNQWTSFPSPSYSAGLLRIATILLVAVLLVTAPGAAQSPNPWSAVAKAAMPAVVNISSSKLVRAGRGAVPADPFFRFFFEGPELAPRRERGLGSGVIVTSDGLLLTNNHVVEGAQDIRVALGDRREFRARLVGVDPRTDLAVLRLPGSGFHAMPLGDSDRVEVADTVLAIGNPFGLGQTVTTGIVSALGRANVGIADYEDFIQTDAAINPGNSGGALINARGELIGINTAIFSRSGGYQGIGFAVPINMVRSVMDHIVRHGRVIRGSIGVGVQDVTPALMRVLALPDLRGVVVSDLAPSGPGARAGIQRGDVVLRVGERVVDGSGQYRNVVAQLAPGSKARLTLRRAGREQTVEVDVIERAETPTRPTNVDPEDRNDPLGMSIADLSPQTTRQLRLPAGTQGVVVTNVMRGGLAEEAGVRPGDLILEVNRQPVKTARDVAKAFGEARAKDVLLLVSRGGAGGYLVIERP
jgi:serine protease Do